MQGTVVVLNHNFLTMKLNNLRDLFLDQLRDMYSAETQSLKVLSSMTQKASDTKLKSRFDTHLKETHGHVEKLEKVFNILGEKKEGHRCKAMAGIIAEIEDLMGYEAPPAVMDAGLIAGEQRIEHYEITGYGTVIEFADELEEKEAKKLLKEIQRDEWETDEELTDRAESGINEEAEGD